MSGTTLTRQELSRLTLADLLDAVPVRNTAVRSERRGERLVLWVKRKPLPVVDRLFKLALPLRDEKGIELDKLGREVWRDCDGSRRVEQIVERFAERHRLRFHEARLSVMRFIEMLMQRNLLGVALLGGDGREDMADALPQEGLAR